MTWLLVNKFYDDVIGGVETVVSQHADYLSNDGEEVVILCCSSKFQLLTKKKKIGAVSVVRCSTFFVFWGMPISISFFGWFVILALKSRNIMLHYPFPLIDIGFCFVPKNKNFFVLWHSEIVRQKFVEKFLRLFTKNLLHKSHIITTSPQMVEYSPYLRQYPKDKISIIPLCLPAAQLKFETVSLNLPSKFFLSLGRIASYKGIDLLLDAVANLEDHLPFPLVLVGDGPLLSKMTEKIFDLKLEQSVILIPRFVTEPEKQYLFAKCEFFVMPSVLPSEAFAITQLEALRANKPVLNTKLNSGVPWVSIDGVTGISVPPGCARSLAEGLNCMFSQYESFKCNPRKRFDDMFDEEVVRANLLKILKDD